MKKLFIPVAAVFLFIALYACEQPAAKSPDANLAPSANRNIALDTGVNAAAAREAIAYWETFVKTANPILKANVNTKPDSSYLRYGYEIPVQDLLDILAEKDPKSNIYAMQAVQKNAAGVRDSTSSIIFQVKDKTGVYRFYDFTAGCPKRCPKL